jgi:hypothetical protein
MFLYYFVYINVYFYYWLYLRIVLKAIMVYLFAKIFNYYTMELNGLDMSNMEMI